MEEGGRRAKVGGMQSEKDSTAIAGFEDGGGGHEPRDTGGIKKLEKARKQRLL